MPRPKLSRSLSFSLFQLEESRSYEQGHQNHVPWAMTDMFRMLARRSIRDRISSMVKLET